MATGQSIIAPDWPLPAGVGLAFTTRQGGVSDPPWDSFNLAFHVGDDPARVAVNRRRLSERLALPAEPAWLRQEHGVEVVRAEDSTGEADTADASYTAEVGLPCAILTADCLPVLFCDRAATRVAAAHAGWRGLAAGILRRTLDRLDVAPARIMAFLGPAISLNAFQVGPEVRAAFEDAALDGGHRQRVREQFRPSPAAGDRLQADLYGLATAELHALGVGQVFSGGFCTFSDRARFYSYRRDGDTGRMASLIWLK